MCTKVVKTNMYPLLYVCVVPILTIKPLIICTRKSMKIGGKCTPSQMYKFIHYKRIVDFEGGVQIEKARKIKWDVDQHFGFHIKYFQGIRSAQA